MIYPIWMGSKLGVRSRAPCSTTGDDGTRGCLECPPSKDPSQHFNQNEQEVDDKFLDP